jgi:hypothetical protein
LPFIASTSSFIKFSVHVSLFNHSVLAHCEATICKLKVEICVTIRNTGREATTTRELWHGRAESPVVSFAHKVNVATSPALLPTEIETTTIQKLQTRVIPFIFVLMVIAFLDRINIGFAALTMNKELAITGQQFGFLTGVFFAVILFLKYPAACCCTSSAREFGLLVY